MRAVTPIWSAKMSRLQFFLFSLYSNYTITIATHYCREFLLFYFYTNYTTTTTRHHCHPLSPLGTSAPLTIFRSVRIHCHAPPTKSRSVTIHHQQIHHCATSSLKITDPLPPPRDPPALPPSTPTNYPPTTVNTTNHDTPSLTTPP